MYFLHFCFIFNRHASIVIELKKKDKKERKKKPILQHCRLSWFENKDGCSIAMTTTPLLRRQLFLVPLLLFFPLSNKLLTLTLGYRIYRWLQIYAYLSWGILQLRVYPWLDKVSKRRSRHLLAAHNSAMLTKVSRIASFVGASHSEHCLKQATEPHQIELDQSPDEEIIQLGMSSRLAWKSMARH